MVGFIENTAMRHRWGGGREVTVTSRLHRQKDTERQRKTEENVERRPVVTPRYESGGEAQARERPARDRGLSLPKTCAARVVANAGRGEQRRGEQRTRIKCGKRLSVTCMSAALFRRNS